TAAAQAPATPVSDALRSIEQRSAKNLVAAIEEMPAEKFGYKPTPAQMSVADIAGHLTEGNDYLCSKIGGVEAPKRAEMPKGASKEQLVARLKETFAFCESALAKVNDSDLSAKVPFFGGREVTRAQAMFVTAEDWADHYSQLATYLRLNGLLPPTAKRS
ncbi:MAG TPA: DinB family protein, partial [Gemmatimonadales bacterium]|nr:DinB family protein [Gemmatimonadales bacterium]